MRTTAMAPQLREAVDMFAAGFRDEGLDAIEAGISWPRRTTETHFPRNRHLPRKLSHLDGGKLH